MYRTDRQPAWQRDVVWLSAILLALAVLFGTLTFTQARLASESRGVAIVRGILRLTLLPGAEGGNLGVRAGASYQAGQPLALLPGLEVYADATEIPTFTVDEAIGRSAGVLADRLVAGGSTAVLAVVTDPDLRSQVARALEGPVASLLRGALEAELLPSGLDDGSRLADWPAQAAANPGQPVQPVVGVFVYLEPAALGRMSEREIGVAVVQQLATTVLAEGLGAAQALVTNVNLGARLDQAADVTARARAHELFATLLLGRTGEMETRLREAQAVLAGEEADESALGGLLPASQLAGLTPEQANEAVLDALAARAYEGGSALAAAQLTRPEQAERVRRVGTLIDGYTAAAHRRYLTWTWLAGVVAAAMLALVMAFSRGFTRLVNAGIAIALGAAPGALLFDVARRSLPEAATLPAGAAAQGVFGALFGLVRYAAAALPRDLVALPLRHHVMVLLVAGSLVLLAIVLWLLRGMRPRRKSFL